MNDSKEPAETRQDPVKTFYGHENHILSIVTFPDGKRIATESVDKTIQIWGLSDGREVKKWVVKKIVNALVILKDGKQVVSAEGDEPGDDSNEPVYRQLWVRDAETGRVVAGPLDSHTSFVFTLDISPDGGILASGSSDSTVILWDTKTWQTIGQPLQCGAAVTCVRFSPTESVWLNSRATPTSTTVATGRSPGLVMAPISSQRVLKMILSSALGTPPPGNRLEIPGLAMMTI
ncbi:hypothetical protein AZE42_06090 [Rhizopogon vesiculosus]|uniref:Uncharacterized protein n=1 Tax=Rhizopogon vesiculosus TaxID=180088 RepID=A0A1J8PIH4_9AGAM|nr:hypothetical protein AZE42_06090 [Rhizopogon vesiculosus]